MTAPNLQPALDSEVIQALKDMGGADDPGLFLDLVQLFLNETPTLIQHIEASFGSGDIKALERAAHSLKSSAANLGALGLSGLSKELEHAGRRNETGPIPDLVRRIRPEFERVCEALRQEAR